MVKYVQKHCGDRGKVEVIKHNIVECSTYTLDTEYEYIFINTYFVLAVF